MPYAPAHPCNWPGCGALVQHGRPRCPAHERQYDLRRGSAKDRGYDSKWARFSRDWRKRFPLCGMRADGQLHTDAGSECARTGRPTFAQCVDHIVPMKRGGSQYDPSNLESKCLRCNNRKRALEEGGFGR